MPKMLSVRLGSDLYIACGRLADRFNKDENPDTTPTKVDYAGGPWTVSDVAAFIVRQYFDPCVDCATAAKSRGPPGRRRRHRAEFSTCPMARGSPTWWMTPTSR